MNFYYVQTSKLTRKDKTDVNCFNIVLVQHNLTKSMRRNAYEIDIHHRTDLFIVETRVKQIDFLTADTKNEQKYPNSKTTCVLKLRKKFEKISCDDRLVRFFH